MEKYVYYYSPDDFTYQGNELAMQSPLEKDVYFLPRNATFKKPPKFQENTIPVYNKESDTWILEKDYRGIAYDKYNKKAVLITSLGELSEGYTKLSPSTPYDIWDEEKGKWVYSITEELSAKKEIKLIENEELKNCKQESGSFYMKDTPVTFAYKDSKGKIIKERITEFYIKIKTPTPPNDIAMATLGLLNLGLSVYPQTFRVDSKDGISGMLVDVTQEELKRFYQMLILGDSSSTGKYTELDSLYTSYKNAIEQAKTMAELDSIKLDYSKI